MLCWLVSWWPMCMTTTMTASIIDCLNRYATCAMLCWPVNSDFWSQLLPAVLCHAVLCFWHLSSPVTVSTAAPWCYHKRVSSSLVCLMPVCLMASVIPNVAESQAQKLYTGRSVGCWLLVSHLLAGVLSNAAAV